MPRKRLITDTEIKHVDFLIMGIGIGLIPTSAIVGLFLFLTGLFLLSKDEYGLKQ